MRAMRSEAFDPTQSQYWTKLKTRGRRKPRNTRQRATELGHSSSVAAPLQPLTVNTSEDQALSQYDALISNYFNSSGTGELPGTVSPFDLEHRLYNASDSVRDNIEQASTAPQVRTQEPTLDQPDSTTPWQDMVPFDINSIEALHDQPYEWRQTRRTAAALGYNPRSQPRTERTVRRYPMPLRSKDTIPRQPEVPQNAQQAIQPSWTPQSPALGDTLISLGGAIVGNNPQWHGGQSNLLDTGNEALQEEGVRDEFWRQH
ncbi:MAG: hypothetical protein Q9166_000952 [cf. Caloplaca sp. 2 TL-2023]